MAGDYDDCEISEEEQPNKVKTSNYNSNPISPI